MKWYHFAPTALMFALFATFADSGPAVITLMFVAVFFAVIFTAVLATLLIAFCELLPNPYGDYVLAIFGSREASKRLFVHQWESK